MMMCVSRPCRGRAHAAHIYIMRYLTTVANSKVLLLQIVQIVPSIKKNALPIFRQLNQPSIEFMRMEASNLNVNRKF